MGKRKYAPIADKAPGQQVTEMRFPSHMIGAIRGDHIE
jgi:hypothetical protein